MTRAFTFSSESVAKISPVTQVQLDLIATKTSQFPQSMLNPSSAPGAPYHSTPLNDLGASLDEVWAAGAIAGVRPINKTLKCVVEKPKVLGAKPKLPLKPEGMFLAKPPTESTVSKSHNSTFGSGQATMSRKSKQIDCSSPLPVSSKTFEKTKTMASSEKEQPPVQVLSTKGEVSTLPQLKPTSKELEVKEKSSNVTVTKTAELPKVPNNKLNAKSPSGPLSSKSGSSLGVSRHSSNILALNEKSPNHMLSTASRPVKAPNRSRSSVSSLNSTRSMSSKQSKRSATTQFNDTKTKMVNSNKVKPTNSIKERLQPVPNFQSKSKLNMCTGESKKNVRDKSDRKDTEQSKSNFTRHTKAADCPNVGRVARLSTGAVLPSKPNTGVTAKSLGTRAKTMGPPPKQVVKKAHLPSASHQPQKSLLSKSVVRGGVLMDRPSLKQGTSKREDPKKKELQRLRRSLDAMAVLARWEGERRESLDLLRCAELEARQVLEKRLGAIRNVEREKEEAEELVARLETAMKSQNIEHEKEAALSERRLEEEREKAERKVASQEVEMERRHQAELESHAAEHITEVTTLKKEIWRVIEQLKEEVKEKEKLQKTVMHLEAKVAALVVSVMQGVEERKEGAIAGLKQEVHSLSMVLEMRSKELREEQERRVTLEMEMEEQAATEKTVRSLRNQVEGLKIQLESKRSCERARELEVAQLQDSLNKESKENRRLSMEREQLEWKVLEATPPAARSLQMREKEEQRYVLALHHSIQ